jgi:hypothetical protein
VLSEENGPQTCAEDPLAYDRLVDDVQLARRFAAIERQLTIVSEHLGVDCPPFASDGVPTAERAADGLTPTTSAEGDPSALPHEVVDLARPDTRSRRSASFATSPGPRSLRPSAPSTRSGTSTPVRGSQRLKENAWRPECCQPTMSSTSRRSGGQPRNCPLIRANQRPPAIRQHATRCTRAARGGCDYCAARVSGWLPAAAAVVFASHRTAVICAVTCRRSRSSSG